MDLLSNIKKAFATGKVQWRLHALARMMERNITRLEVKDLIDLGELIEIYPETKPYPSCLIWINKVGKTLHVVAAFDEKNDLTYIVTVYEPDEKHFMPDLKTRKEGAP